jgi:hypothetical protein
MESDAFPIMVVDAIRVKWKTGSRWLETRKERNLGLAPLPCLFTLGLPVAPEGETGIRFCNPPLEKPQQALQPLLSGLELLGEDSNLEPSG